MDDSCVEMPLCENLKTPNKEEQLKSDKGSDTSSSSPSGRSSPEANCPICLGKPENKSFTDSCLHQFCFTCLLEWSKVKAECPLCKQSFKSIIHNVRSIEDYDEYILNTSSSEGRLLGLIARYEASETREPFRYRTTAVSSYLDYFVRLEEAISHHVIPSIPTHSGSTHWQRRRQYGTSDFRRNIYQQGLWVQRMRDFTGSVRESSPEFYRSNPGVVHRLVPWLNRELNVLCNNNEQQVQMVISRILELITQFPIRSAVFSTAVSSYIGRHTEHFIHEFYNYASSPFDLIGYDRHANYVGRNSLAHEVHSDEDSDSDVQIVGAFTSTSPLRPIQLDSDSDECVVVDSIPPRNPSPEVITLESEPDDDIVQVNIHIEADVNRPGPSRRPPLKRNWLTVKNVHVPTSSSDNVNVSINIAHGSKSRSSSPAETSSSSSWSPCRKKSVKKKIKKEKSRKKKSLKTKSTKSKRQSKSRHLPSSILSIRNRSVSPAVKPKRRKPSIMIKSSSDDDSNGLHIVTDNFSSSSSDESEYKPRIRSVVIKSSVKQEPQISTPELTPSRSDCQWIESNLESNVYDYVPQNYIDSDTDMVDSFDLYKPRCRRRSRTYTSSSSEHPSSKKFKYSKRKLKKEKV